MAEVTFTKEFDWFKFSTRGRVEWDENNHYFDNYLKNVHYKSYPIDRTQRRIELEKTFMTWLDSGAAYGFIRDNKDAQFARTVAIVNGKKKYTSYALYQSLLNVVKRSGNLCTCEGDEKPCNKVIVWWELVIPNLIIIYRHGAK